MKTILLIHGMFQNEKSWKGWVGYYTARGYKCIAPSWPEHEGDPGVLRANPPAALGDLRLETVMKRYEEVIAGLGEKPIAIGHSVGGLLVQLLANKNLISMGVAISSVAPNKMLSLEWNFFKNSVTILNPFKGDEPIYQTPETFHTAFCNTLSKQAAQLAFEQTATHDSRNVLRDCVLEPGRVDLSIPHVPLLFIAGEQDRIIPDQLVEKNAHAYTDPGSVTAFKAFPRRSHFICNEPGWEVVAGYVNNWIKQHEPAADYQRTTK